MSQNIQKQKPILFLLHKPKNVVVTKKDELNRKTVYDLLPPFAFKEGWTPIGRLDKDSRGLLLFTKEGSIVDLLTKPGGFSKIYELLVRGHVTDTHIEMALKGVPTNVGVLRVEKIEKLGLSGPKTKLTVELKEGKNRHLRRLFGALKDEKFGTSLKVLELKRVRIGPIKLDIPSEQWRFLTVEEENKIIACMNPQPPTPNPRNLLFQFPVHPVKKAKRGL